MMQNQSSAQQINALRKAGRMDEAWALARQAAQREEMDFGLDNAFFWTAYAVCKRAQARIKAQTERNPNQKNQPQPHEQQEINNVCEWLLWADIPISRDENQYIWLLRINQKNMEYFPNLILLLIRKLEDLFQSSDAQPY